MRKTTPLPIEELPLPQRLALSYAPGRMRAPLAALFAFDARLGQLVRQASEPMLGQLRLAWWRDTLARPLPERPRGDAVLDALASLEGLEASLSMVVDGWEVLLSDRVGGDQALSHAQGRASGFAALAESKGDDATGVERLAQIWAAADLVSKLSRSGERSEALQVASRLASEGTTAGRDWRSLAILAGLSRRSLVRGGGGLLDGPASMALALRIGLLGR